MRVVSSAWKLWRERFELLLALGLARTKADLARREGVSRAWVTKVMGVQAAQVGLAETGEDLPGLREFAGIDKVIRPRDRVIERIVRISSGAATLPLLL